VEVPEIEICEVIRQVGSSHNLVLVLFPFKMMMIIVVTIDIY
jgi:hypothetical protein